MDKEQDICSLSKMGNMMRRIGCRGIAGSLSGGAG
jgi:hypothetical protein